MANTARACTAGGGVSGGARSKAGGTRPTAGKGRSRNPCTERTRGAMAPQDPREGENKHAEDANAGGKGEEEAAGRRHEWRQ